MQTPPFLILGSAAAEGVPAYFCDCRVCREAAARGGREIRGRTSYNFGGVLQIDFGPDMLQAFQRFYPRLNAMRHLLVTHAHEDHLAPGELWFRASGFSRLPADTPPLTIHGAPAVLDRLQRGIAPTIRDREKVLEMAHLAFNEIAPFQTFELPDIGATVRTFPAKHAPGLMAMLFLITMGGRTIFIGNDTGFFPDETFDALKALAGKVHVDIFVVDCCGSFLQNYRDFHMSADVNLELFAKLEQMGFIDSATVKVANHFSHNGNATHAELCEFFEPKGVVVGYDGLEL